jgi:heptosyltransferase-2
LTYLSGARSRVGYSERSSAAKQVQTSGYDRFLTNVVDDRSVKHEVQRNLDLLTALGMSPSDNSLEVWLTDEDQSVAEGILPSQGSDLLVALALGAGEAKRIWPIERFVKVGRWLTDEGFRLVVVGGPGEEGLGDTLRRRLRGVIDVTNKITLRQTAALLGRCSFFCGNDAGPMHLAAAAGIPIVEISCHSRRGDDLHSNSPTRFGPWGVPHKIVRPQEPADRCAAGCRGGEPHCILNVPVDSVIAAIGSLRQEMAALGSVDAS